MAEPVRGYNLVCPCCAARGAIVLAVDQVERLHCIECDSLFSTETVRAFLDAVSEWRVALLWLRSVPPYPRVATRSGDTVA